MNHLITIVGPTAIGKTALSIQLAHHFNCDILSSDSRQFFKEMTIGTAVPSKEELKEARHHFIQNKSIFNPYSVGAFEKEALDLLTQLFETNTTQIMVGGSGLYVDAVLNGLDYFPEVAPEVRVQLNLDLQNKGIQYLQHQLEMLDIQAFNTIAIDNPHRLIRALEICIGTGKTFSSFKNKPKKKRNFQSIKIGLMGDRGLVYERINHRVDLMMQDGLLEEAKELYPHRHLNALQTVGYTELFKYFDGEWTLDFAISEIKKNTRRFAKRQLTWFKKDTQTLWFDFTTPLASIISDLEAHIRESVHKSDI